MKKTAAMILALVMVFLLCACGLRTVSSDVHSAGEEKIKSKGETSEGRDNFYVGTWEMMALDYVFPFYSGEYSEAEIEMVKSIYTFDITEQEIKTAYLNDKEKSYPYDKLTKDGYTYLEFAAKDEDGHISQYYLVFVTDDLMMVCPPAGEGRGYKATSPSGIEIISSARVPEGIYVKRGSEQTTWPMTMSVEQFEEYAQDMLDLSSNDRLIKSWYYPSSKLLLVLFGDEEFQFAATFHVVSGNVVEYLEEIALTNSEGLGSERHITEEGYVITDDR